MRPNHLVVVCHNQRSALNQQKTVSLTVAMGVVLPWLAGQIAMSRLGVVFIRTVPARYRSGTIAEITAMVPDQTASNPRFVAAEILALVVVNTDRPTKISKKYFTLSS